MKRNHSFSIIIIIAVIISAVFLAVVVRIIHPMARTLDIAVPSQGSIEYSDFYIECTEDNIVKMTAYKKSGEYYLIRLEGISSGETDVAINAVHAEDHSISDAFWSSVTKTKSGILYTSNTLNFNGYQYLFIAVTIVFTIFAILMLIHFIQSKRKRYFSYETILSLGLFMYFSLQSMALLPFAIESVIDPHKRNGIVMFLCTGYVLSVIALFSTPFPLIFSVFISSSNIKLIKKEGRSFTNLLGFVISFMLFGGLILIILLIKGSTPSLDIAVGSTAKMITRNIVASLFVYFECNLLATFILCQIAGRHKPKLDKDHIIILGCGIRDDGTLFPLLRGRADAAIAFYKKQLAETGKAAIFVPSGGQGPDECMPEGEAIKRYLLEQGIPEDHILPETRSENTYQNMKYSKAIIDKDNPDSKMIFATTNYHVYRSGILAASVGMNADGVGAKTKWYFWPNALIREFIGMVVNGRKIHIALCILLVAQSIILGNLQWLLQIIF